MRKQLYEARENMNLSHREVAQKVDISRSFYTLIEGGKKNPSIDVAIRIGKVLNVRPEELENLFEK